MNPSSSTPSFLDYLRVVLPHLDEALLAPAARARLEAMSAQLPVCSKAVLEFRLADSPQADLSFCLPRDVVLEPLHAETGEAWRRLREIGLEWVDDRSAIHRHVVQLWLEFDGDLGSAELPQPMVFFTSPQGEIGRENLVSFAEALCRAPLSRGQYATLRSLQEKVPRGIWFKQVGLMQRGGASIFRVVLRDIPGGGIDAVLREVGWCGDERFGPTVAEMSGLVDSMAVTVDVREALGPRVCLELFLDGQVPQPQRWSALLGHLVTRGFCRGDKAAALLRWPGVNRKAEPPGYWPANLELVDSILGSSRVSLFLRTLSHLKLGFEPGRPIEAKGYIGLEHAWFERARLAQASSAAAPAMQVRPVPRER